MPVGAAARPEPSPRWPTAGRAQRYGRSWTTPATPVTPSSADGGGRRYSPIPTTWQPGTSPASAGPSRSTSCALASRRTRRSCRWRCSRKPSCCAHPAPPAAWPRRRKLEHGLGPAKHTVPAPRTGPLRALHAEDGGHPQARPQLLPVRDPPAGAGLTGVGHASAQRLPPGTCGAAGPEHVDRGTLRPGQHRPDRRRATGVPGRRPRLRQARAPRSIETRSSGGWPTPRRASRASEPRSRPEPTRPRWSSRSTPHRSSAPPRKPNSGCSSPTRPG